MGGRRLIVWGNNDWNDEKNEISYSVALDDHQSTMAHTTTNQKRAGVV
jgi:hypothetical protein